MPILKPISGHGTVSKLRTYLEKKNRALGRDVLNLPLRDEWICEERGQRVIPVEWDVEMDDTREAYGTNKEWRGMRARTFKHFVVSPNPGAAEGALAQVGRIELPEARGRDRLPLRQRGQHPACAHCRQQREP